MLLSHGGEGLEGDLGVKVNIDQNQVGLFMSSLSQVENLEEALTRVSVQKRKEPPPATRAVTHHRSAKNIDIFCNSRGERSPGERRDAAGMQWACRDVSEHPIKVAR